MKPIIQSLSKDSFYPVHEISFFLFKESEMENPTYFLIITMAWGGVGGKSSKNRESCFLLLYLIF